MQERRETVKLSRDMGFTYNKGGRMKNNKKETSREVQGVIAHQTAITKAWIDSSLHSLQAYIYRSFAGLHLMSFVILESVRKT